MKHIIYNESVENESVEISFSFDSALFTITDNLGNSISVELMRKQADTLARFIIFANKACKNVI